MKISSASFHEFIPLLWLALGTFATGTESFMIAALLPGLAADLSVSITAAGQLMTVFALTYALSSPILAAATGGVGRRKLLLLSMTAFAAANFIAAAAVDYWQLMAARILLAARPAFTSRARARWRAPWSRRSGAAPRSPLSREGPVSPSRSACRLAPSSVTRWAGE